MFSAVSRFTPRIAGNAAVGKVIGRRVGRGLVIRNGDVMASALFTQRMSLSNKTTDFGFKEVDADRKEEMVREVFSKVTESSLELMLDVAVILFSVGFVLGCSQI
jgi:hypothetical protein